MSTPQTANLPPSFRYRIIELIATGGMAEVYRAGIESVHPSQLAAAKSPTEFFQLQSAIVRKQFDGAVAQASKNTAAFLKLANDAGIDLEAACLHRIDPDQSQTWLST